MIEIKTEEVGALKKAILNSIADLELMISDADKSQKSMIAQEIYHLENIIRRIIRSER